MWVGGNYAKKLIANGIDGANAYLLIITAAAVLPNHFNEYIGT